MLIAFGREAVIHFCECNAYKYIWRYKNKNGMEDLEKARWYVEKAFTLVDDYTLEGEFATLFGLKEIVTKLIAKEKKVETL
jgi:ribosomal protein S2